MVQPIDVLTKTFGFPTFRQNQKEIINRVLSGKDTFVLMPTGGGKSLCYQVPALIFEGVTLVISPLIALMKDQVDALRVNGVPAAYLNSSQSPSEQSHIMDLLRNQQLKLLYLAPERLLGKQGQFFSFLKQLKVSLIAIDEAHCISQWGHDFRPEYLMLARLKEELADVPVIALTATADKLTQKDILGKLALKSPQTYLSSFNRANIQYLVEPKQNSYHRLLDFLADRRDDSGIIYTLSRKSAKDLAERLSDEGYAARPYHAGLENRTKEQHQDLFLKDEVKIIVATIAFGMGIDKSNVRYVVHMDLPKNLESYYQETGRAGRDGLPSQALLFYSYADVLKLKGFASVENNAEQTRIMLKKLDQMADFCQIRYCRRKYLLNYFDEKAPDHCGNCDVCLTPRETIDGTVIAQKVLSAVVRLNGRFGINYVVDFLRGSKSEKIRAEHKSLKTYGVGAEISKEDWLQYINELMGLDYLKKSEGEYPLLQLTQRSAAVLTGKEHVALVKPGKKIEQRVETALYELDLLSELKKLRTKKAVEENVPPYLIFSDSTLIELATYLPQSFNEIQQISGFGEVKSARYGEDFLQIVTAYCRQRNLASRISTKKAKKQRREPKEKKTDTKMMSFERYKQGLSLSEIAEQRNLNLQTIEGHLAYFILEGSIKVTELVPENKLPAITMAINVHGQHELGPIKQALGEDYNYGEIKAVINHLKHEGKLS